MCRKARMRRRAPGEGVLLVVAVVLCASTTACSLDRWVHVAAGTYEPIGDGGTSAAASEIRSVFLDRENSTVWLKRASGSVVVRRFSARARAGWPAGCPTNLYSTRMEVLELGEQALDLLSSAIEEPILVRGCPRDPVVVVLRDDGEIGGGAAACYGAEQCITFEPATADFALPRSAKGYELYSWRVEGRGEWRHTLVTGTNRLKSYIEVTTTDSSVADQGIGTITVQVTDALKSILRLLPEGELVIWRDVRSTDGAPQIDDGYPSRRVVREVTRYARRNGLDWSMDD